MRFKLIAVLLILSGSSATCLYYDQKQLFEAADFQGKAKVDEILTKLNSDEGPLSNEQVFYLLGGLSRTSKIGSYLVPQYTNLARLSTEKCLRGAVLKHEAICDETPIGSLKRYCHFCLEQLLGFCRESKDAALDLYWLSMGARIDRASRETQLMSSRFNRFVSDGKLEAGNSVGENMARFCGTGSQFEGLIPLKNVRQNCRLLVQVVGEDLAQVGLSAEATIEAIETKFKLSLRDPVKFCKLLLGNSAE